MVPSDSDEKEFLSNVPYATVTDALAMFKDDELVAEPGTKFRYTTHGFTLVSAVLEKVSGKEFKKLVEDLTFQLGMGHTILDTNNRIVPHRASYYKRNKKHMLENCPEVDNSYKWAGGGLLSNVTDLLIFANAMLFSHQAGAASANAFINSDVIRQLWKGRSPWITRQWPHLAGCVYRTVIPTAESMNAPLLAVCGTTQVEGLAPLQCCSSDRARRHQLIVVLQWVFAW